MSVRVLTTGDDDGFACKRVLDMSIGEHLLTCEGKGECGHCGG